MNDIDITWDITDVDWTLLRTSAAHTATLAYCPYSGLEVGAAALTLEGQIVTGCNVENTSFGLTLCAECTLVGNLHTMGVEERLIAITTRLPSEELIMPCGRCRQVLYEFGGPQCWIDTPRGVETLSDILPDAPGTWKYETSSI